MRQSTYLFLSRHKVYYLRWPIPKHLHPFGKVGHIKLSLKTDSLKVASNLATCLAGYADWFTNTLNSDDMIYEDIVQLVRSKMIVLLEQRQAAYRVSGALTDNEAKSNNHWATFYTKYNRQDRDASNTVYNHASIMVNRFFKDMDLADEQREMVVAEFIKQYPGLLANMADLDKQGISTFQTSAMPSEVSKSQTPLKSLIEKYVAEHVSDGFWVHGTRLERDNHFGVLVEILGEDYSVEDIDARKVHSIRDIIVALPFNRKKNLRLKNMPIKEAVRDNMVKKISKSTANQYLETYEGLFKWLKQKHFIDVNYFEGSKLKIKKSKAKAREYFTTSEMGKILDGLENSELVKEAHHYWGVYIAAYTGARVSEIAQLKVSDIHAQSDIWYFRFTDEGENQSLKSEASKRDVPIHPKLIEKGLLDYINKQKDMLFPKLSYSKKSGYSRKISDWFNNRYLVKLGLKTDKHVFHSLRHTVVTELRRKDVTEPIANAITGHSNDHLGTAQAVYNHGYTLQQLHSAVQRLDYTFAKKEALATT